MGATDGALGLRGISDLDSPGHFLSAFFDRADLIHGRDERLGRPSFY